MTAPLEDADEEDERDEELPARQDRCVDLELESGDVVIYDVENHSAWIQSDDAVPVERLE